MPIVNDNIDQAGSPVAWVRNQRYVSLSRLMGIDHLDR
jgi:hypothetical protein